VNRLPFDHFNAIAGLYNRAASFQASPALLQLLDLSEEIRLLDAGGGTGRVAKSLRNKVSMAVVADLSTGMLKYAHQKDLPSVCTPSEKLPFSSQSFERVIMIDALHHVIDQRSTVEEMWRVLSPGGKILIIEPDIHKFVMKLVAVGEKILLMRSHFLAHEKIKALFAGKTASIRIEKLDENQVMVLVEKVGQL
jgi:ubiquinone/menaquinone biosynthesis C-methylase UbiE